MWFEKINNDWFEVNRVQYTCSNWSKAETSWVRWSKHGRKENSVLEIGLWDWWLERIDRFEWTENTLWKNSYSRCRSCTIVWYLKSKTGSAWGCQRLIYRCELVGCRHQCVGTYRRDLFIAGNGLIKSLTVVFCPSQHLSRGKPLHNADTWGDIDLPIQGFSDSDSVYSLHSVSLGIGLPIRSPSSSMVLLTIPIMGRHVSKNMGKWNWIE